MDATNSSAITLSWVEAQWLNNENCHGPPSILFSFDTLDPSEESYFDPTSYSHWPIFYGRTIIELLHTLLLIKSLTIALNIGSPYPITACGYSAVNLKEREFCCSSSVSLDDSFSAGSYGVKSGADLLISGDSGAGSFYPASASEKTYCELHASSAESLFLYTSILILDDQQCNKFPVYGGEATFSISCSKSGEVLLYQDDICSTGVELFQLTSTAQDFNSNSTGEFSARMTAISQSDFTNGWTTVIPMSKHIFQELYLIPFSLHIDMLVPIFQETPEIIGVFSYALSILFFLWCLATSFARWLQRRLDIDMIPPLSFFIWILAVCLEMVCVALLFLYTNES